jgi:tight adherence protein C
MSPFPSLSLPIFPLVIFIFPAIFVVLVGPAAITMINELFPSMNNGQ